MNQSKRNGENPMKLKRETPYSLFGEILKMARESGCFKEVDEILDYAQAFKFDENANRDITHYEFDTEFCVRFGSNEGIYIHASIVGFPFGRSKQDVHIPFGTVKILNTDFQSMTIMGKACGVLEWFAHKYVMDNIHRFSSEPEDKKEA